MSLLSGGEKALTAVSLIFSIFLVKPSPYCLLDEVDAPLDDANVFRFNDLVKEMAKRSQIIIVTHNKHTMKVNNTLYGVTMEEKGVSKMVSVSLEASRESGRNMKKHLLIICSLGLLTPNLWAQEGKVVKAKGHRVIVDFPPGTDPRVGDVVTINSLASELGSGSSSTSSSSTAPSGSRDHTLGFGANFTTKKQRLRAAVPTNISANARWGWNKVTMEYGPLCVFRDGDPR